LKEGKEDWRTPTGHRGVPTKVSKKTLPVLGLGAFTVFERELRAEGCIFVLTLEMPALKNIVRGMQDKTRGGMDGKCDQIAVGTRKSLDLKRAIREGGATRGNAEQL